MAVNLVTPAHYGFTVASYFGITTNEIAQAKKYGICIESNKSGVFRITVAKLGSISTVGLVKIQPAAIKLAKEKKLGPASLVAVKAQFRSALKKATEEATTTEIPGPLGNEDPYSDHPVKVKKMVIDGNGDLVQKESGMPDMEQSVMASTNNFGGVQPNKAAKFAEMYGAGPTVSAKVGKPKVKNFITPDKATAGNKQPMNKPLAQMPSTHKQMVGLDLSDIEKKVAAGLQDSAECAVLLATAKALYQPVIGTSADSVYRVIAMYSGMNIAARLNTTGSATVSFRAEGDKLHQYMDTLAIMGFDSKISGTGKKYASVHYVTGHTLEVSKKSFGAILGLLGVSSAKEIGEIGGLVAYTDMPK